MSHTLVWRHDDDVVIGYYTLAAHVLVKDQLPLVLWRGSPERIAAALVARLALDRSLQGQGHGSVALAEALGPVVEATNVVAARFVVVDAIDDDAVRFHAH